MKNRFIKSRGDKIKNIIYTLPLLLFIIIGILFVNGVSSVSQTTLSKQRDSLETALHRSISQCYAVEGIYPPSLSYIEEHYGLTYDKKLFYVDYQILGGNLFPEITILMKEGGQ